MIDVAWVDGIVFFPKCFRDFHKRTLYKTNGKDKLEKTLFNHFMQTLLQIPVVYSGAHNPLFCAQTQSKHTQKK